MLEFTVEIIERIDKFLATKTQVSRGRVQAAIKSGLVMVDGKYITETDHKVLPGQVISLPEFEDESLKPMVYDLRIVYENENIIVIDKPSNLVVHPGAGHKQDTLSNALIAKYPQISKVGELSRPGIVHRLDEDTSGLIVAAKTQTGYEFMKNLFMTRQVEKEYITLVHGIPEKIHEIIKVPIGRSSTHVKMKTGIGKEAVTEYRILETNEKTPGLDQMALLKVKLHTGRTHQIRVHMAYIGHPVVGDQLYGGNFKKQDLQLIHRQFLHAAQLKFKLPDGTLLDLGSELPQDLQEVLKKVNITYDARI
ncbi:MAG: RluA family pseudouridine synthase [Candidatus Doudnabacteria bacterium]|nr:RluA family pseudouridine synthase [Candidatus Doudnabacteria bacterium]